MTFTRYAAALIAALAFTVAVTAQAGAYPTKPVRIVAPAPPGGGTDFLARLLGRYWTENTGQPVVTDNITGANGNIGAAQVSRAEPDGATLLMSYVGTQSINPALYKSMPYDPKKDLEPIAELASYPFVIAVNPDVPAHSIKELIQYAKANKNELSFGSAGVGSGGHLVGEMFNKRNGTNIMHVPYRGSAPAITDLLAGQLQVVFDTLNTVGPFIKTGKIRALAVTSDARIESFPDIPTVAEAGHPDMVISGWYGLFAPKSTPAALLQSINDGVGGILRTQDYQDKVRTAGYVPSSPQSTEQFRTFVDDETKRWSELAKSSGAAID
ncbi:tripartite tricarboxylate transporter substrate binding protein [Bordetella sp. BOR01]|uniref:Bug family tripartite tricarboxylate transporter substrate binding protein n=1 Tax=Bordetella sp. BOR01 TaxID=2854779 RepID=UPI001C43C2FB|nr:tripartite tricarboxylate transporter substrate binding protein [Bordetella sp. BOR01]MBV7486051.1 tripartite tricarboxylate transporter substrate binding protein [Bordetella sp. BOR01]